MSYLRQLQQHKASLELTIKQCDNDIAYNEKNIQLLHQQRETIAKQIELIDETIVEEESNL